MKWLWVLLAVAVVSAGCGVVKFQLHTTKSPICLWPDPIIFTVDDDSWPVCFQITKSEMTAQVRCTTVHKLRLLADPQRAN